MDRLLILHKNDPEIAALSLVDTPPETNPSIRLNALSVRMLDHTFDPFQLDPLTVRSAPVVEEVLGEYPQKSLPGFSE